MTDLESEMPPMLLTDVKIRSCKAPGQGFKLFDSVGFIWRSPLLEANIGVGNTALLVRRNDLPLGLSGCDLKMRARSVTLRDSSSATASIRGSTKSRKDRTSRCGEFEVVAREWYGKFSPGGRQIMQIGFYAGSK